MLPETFFPVSVREFVHMDGRMDECIGEDDVSVREQEGCFAWLKRRSWMGIGGTNTRQVSGSQEVGGKGGMYHEGKKWKEERERVLGT